jgi:integrase
MKLTDAAIRNLKPREKDYTVFDDEVKGFGVRVSPGGTKSFVFMYLFQGQRKRYPGGLGEYPHKSLADARALAWGYKGILKNEKRDPAVPKDPVSQPAGHVHKADTSTERGHGMTFGQLLEEYKQSQDWRDLRGSTKERAEYYLEQNVTPIWADVPLSDITRAGLANWGKGIVERGAPYTANKAWARMQTIWNWGLSRAELTLPPSPFFKLAKPFDEPKTPGGRLLTPDQIVKHFDALMEEPRDLAGWWLLMWLHLTRRTETGWLERSEIVRESERGAYWKIPGEKTKNGQEHLIPLTNYSTLLLGYLGQMSEHETYLLPSPVGNGPRVTVTGKPAQRMSERAGFAHSPHDIRHTAASIMGELGIEPHIIDSLLNHALPTDSSVTRWYNRARVWAYFNEKREATERWHAHLSKILGGALSTYIVEGLTKERSYEARIRAVVKSKRIG